MTGMKHVAFPLTRLELAGMECPCGKAACDDDLFFHGRCHLQAPVEAAYQKRTGLLILKCAICHQLIARVKVAAGHLDISAP